MPATALPVHALRRYQPVLAALLAACIVLLGLAAASPSLHEALCHGGGALAHACDPDETGHAHHGDPAGAHADDAGADEGHVCAVTLFSAGCDSPVAPTLCPSTALHASGAIRFAEFLLSRTLRGPERVCGPPARA